MGKNCDIIRNNDNAIVEVKAPNGKDSVLYQEARSMSGSSERAALIWGTAYTKEFKDYFGDWQVIPTEYDLDQNGEPRLDDVISYLERDNYVAGKFMADELLSLSNTMISSGYSTIRDLSIAIRSKFMRGGLVYLTKDTLLKSGLYTQEEVNHIMGSYENMRSVLDMMERVASYSDIPVQGSKDEYFMSHDIPDGNIVYGEGYDMLGKRNIVNPAEVDSVMERSLGGIKSREDFDSAFASLPYPSLVERYEEDPVYAKEMYDTYSRMSRFDLFDVYGNNIIDSSSYLLRGYASNPNVDIPSIREDLSGIIDNEEDNTDDMGSLLAKVRKIALSLSYLGIDISDMVDMDLLSGKSDTEIRDVMASIDVFVNSLHERNEVESDPLAEAIDTFTGRTRQAMSVGLDIKGGPVPFGAKIRSSVNPREMFKRGFLYIGRNLFVRSAPSVNKEEMYESLTDIAIASPSFFGKKIFPTSYYSDGAINMSMVENPSNRSEIMDMVKSYVMSKSSLNNTEEMVMSKIAYGLDPSMPMDNKVDIGRQLSRFKAILDRKGDNRDNIMTAMDLYGLKIREKIKGSVLYDNALRFMEFSPSYAIYLNTHDPETLKKIELSLPSSIRDKLLNYALDSDDSTMSDLFYLPEVSDIYDNNDFRRWLYLSHPAMLHEYGGDSVSLSTGRIKIRDMYDDFVSMGGSLFEKVGETRDGYSVYDNMGDMSYGDTDLVAIRRLTSVTRSSVSDDSSLGVPVAPSVSIESNKYTAASTTSLASDFTC